MDRRGAQAVTASIPAPVGGLNTRDELASMPPTDASVLTNMFAYADRVATRYGNALLSTATVTPPGGGLSSFEGFRALMKWNAKGTETVFGAYYWGENVAGVVYPKLRFYSVATNGVLTNSREAVATGTPDTLSSLGEWTMFTSGSGTTYMVVCVSQSIGGVPTFTPQAYDGTAWSAPAITGVPAGTMGVHVHRNRQWFYGTLDTTNAPKGLSAWYLPIGAISGAAVEFNVGPFASRGGRIVALRTWTLDGGTGGADDLAVFLTDRGQAIVYEGTDPSSLATWRLVGVFDVGTPASSVGDNTGFSTLSKPFAPRDSFAMKYGADTVLLLSDGLTSANAILRPHNEGQDYTLSAKIRSLFTDYAISNGALGSASSTVMWKMVYHPTLRQVIVTIPTNILTTPAPGVRTQVVTACTWLVMNSETGAWQQFSGMNVVDAVVVGTGLYFTDGGGSIYKYSSAAADDAGTAITYEARQAYANFGSANVKLLTLMQPMLRATGNFSLTAKVDVDFNGEAISTYTSYTVPAEANVNPWTSPAKFGRYAATHLKGQTSAGIVSWYATNWAAKQGGLL
jgi:hypothetical protein